MERVDDRAQVVVDLEVVVTADVFGRVERVRLVGNLVEEALDSGGVVAHARKVAHEVPVKTLGLTLEVAEVEVASAAEQLDLVGVVGLDDLEAARLRVGIASRTQRKAVTLGLVVVLEELGHVVEGARQRARQAVRVGQLHIAEGLVVEGRDVVDVGALDHLEMDLGVLEDELVGVVLVQLAGERAVGEAGVHVVDLDQAFVEEVADGARADPVVVVGVDGTVRREAPVVAVEEGADKGARQILGGEDRAVDRELARGDLLRLGEAEALDDVRALGEDGPDGVKHGGAKVGGLGLVDHIRRNDHVAVAELEHTTVLGEEVVLHVREGRKGQGLDVGGEERHFKWMFEKLGSV